MNRKKFTIPRITEDNSGLNNQGLGTFVGPYSGRNTTKKEVFPYVSYGNNGRQYQGLNSKPNNFANEEDKYSPDRIPSYLRPEQGGSGISRNSLAYLKGEKMTLEQMRKASGVYQETNTPVQNIEANYEDDLEDFEEDNSPEVKDYLLDEEYDEYEEYQEYDDELEEYEEENEEDEELVKEDEYEDDSYEEELDLYDNNPFKQFSGNNYKPEPVKEEPKSSLRPITGMKSKEEADTFYEKELDFIHVSKPKYEETNVKLDSAHQVKKQSSRKKKYVAPPLNILKRNTSGSSMNTDIQFQINTIDQTLAEFRVGGHVLKYTKGPTVTQFEVKLDPGVNVNKVNGLAKNLQMNLASESIRIETPIPGKPTVGIEVPNPVKDKVLFGDLMSNKEYYKDGKPLNVVIGQQIDGKYKYADITAMPHALVAGSTGSGKTVCLYSIIASILFKATPDEVKLILIDPKSNELTFFNDIPHLACPVIDDPKVATASIKWAVEEMGRRYALLKASRKRTILDYNEYVEKTGEGSKLPYIVIVIDEFADLMNTASDSFETNVQRLTQKARSAGIHMIIATQRPSTDVIKGTIKANITTRMAFNVKSNVDSITILDHQGAEKLLGKGDMLYTNGGNDLRVQGAFITEDEIEQVADYLVEQNSVEYMFTLDELNSASEDEVVGEAEENQLFEDCARYIVRHRNASMNQIQKLFKIGYNKADEWMNELQELGIVSGVVPGRQRQVIVTDESTLERLLQNRR